MRAKRDLFHARFLEALFMEKRGESWLQGGATLHLDWIEDVSEVSPSHQEDYSRLLQRDRKRANSRGVL